MPLSLLVLKYILLIKTFDTGSCQCRIKFVSAAFPVSITTRLLLADDYTILREGIRWR